VHHVGLLYPLPFLFTPTLISVTLSALCFFTAGTAVTGITGNNIGFPVLSNNSSSFYWLSAKYMAAGFTFIKKQVNPVLLVHRI
jgi:hypothetical protein